MDRLHYAGNVGTGFNEITLTELREKLGSLVTDKIPLANLRAIAKAAHWVAKNIVDTFRYDRG